MMGVNTSRGGSVCAPKSELLVKTASVCAAIIEKNTSAKRKNNNGRVCVLPSIIVRSARPYPNMSETVLLCYARSHTRRAISRDLAAISCSFTVRSSRRRIKNLPPTIVLSTMPPDTPKSTWLYQLLLVMGVGAQ